MRRMSLALLHTSPAHVPVFDALRDAHHPGLVLRHLVHKDLLDRAGESGPETVAADVEALVADAVAEGAAAVLCTCSTLGGVAESVGVRLGVPVLRVDRPMAAAAVRAGRVTVLAAHHATLQPTRALLVQEAERAGSGTWTCAPSWSTGRGSASRPGTTTATWSGSRPPPTP